MSRLVRNRSRAEYLDASFEAMEVEPRLTPMADARALSAALERVHGFDAQRADIGAVFNASLQVIAAAAVHEELGVES